MKMQKKEIVQKLIDIGSVDCDELKNLFDAPIETLQSWYIDAIEERLAIVLKENAKLKGIAV